MKLIDKEQLLLALKKKRYSKQSLDLIESQPVVDAIPVEHIRKYLKTHQNDIKALLIYWEKENETN